MQLPGYKLFRAVSSIQKVSNAIHRFQAKYFFTHPAAQLLIDYLQNKKQ